MAKKDELNFETDNKIESRTGYHGQERKELRERFYHENG